MATIGLSKPYFAKYNYDAEVGGTPSYSDGGLLGKYTDLSITLSGSEDNILYADNGPDEADKQFSGGSASITTNDLLAAVMLKVLGVTEEAITAEGMATENAKWLLFDDDQSIPYLGLGGIIKKQVGGVTKWWAFVLPKIQFTNPGIVATTQGETITWQTQQLSTTIMRSDEPKHRWFMLSNELVSEADAEKAVKAYLNIA